MPVVMTFALQGCAVLNNLKSGNLKGATEAAAKEAQLFADAKKYGDTECAPINTTELSWEEERAVGGAVGVGLVTKGGHLFIEGVTEKNPEVLNADLKKAKLPDNEKNELTAYLSVTGRNLARFSDRKSVV